MKDRKLALRYARALLSVVDDPGTLERIDQLLSALVQALAESPELRSAMLDPAMPRSARTKLLRSMVEQNGLPAEVGNFFDTLVENNRLAALDAIAVVFHEERERRQGIVAAEMSTATPVNDELRQRAQRVLEQVTGAKVRLTCNVEPDLIGGVVTKIGSTVYDGSLRSQLEQLKRKMAEG
jgi:F-type H+-transporting ATPase subunit delta